MAGKRSLLFARPPVILGAGCVAGEKEGKGAFGKYYDLVEEDPLFGGKTWEEAESKMQQLATQIALRKAAKEPGEIRYLVAGDLLGQLIATSFGIMNFNIPMFGVYGACSTMGESLAIASMLIDGGFADYTVALTSSHFASAESTVSVTLAWQPASLFFYLDGDRKRSPGTGFRRSRLEKNRYNLCPGYGSHHRNHHGLWY